MRAKKFQKCYLDSPTWSTINHPQKILLVTLLSLQNTSGNIIQNDQSLMRLSDLHMDDFKPALEYFLNNPIISIDKDMIITQQLKKDDFGYIMEMSIDDKKKGLDIPLWRSDSEEGFKAYLELAEQAFTDIQKDVDWLTNMKKWYPNVLIGESLMKSFKTFWGTKEGWLNKKKKHGDKIDWKKTITNTIKYSFIYREKNIPDYELSYINDLREQQKCLVMD